MQRLHKFIPQTQREKSLVLVFSVASSVVTSVLMTQEWFSGYTKVSKSSQAESPALVLGEPIQKSEQAPGTIPGGIVTGGRSPSEYAVTRGFSAPQSVSLLANINRWECQNGSICPPAQMQNLCAQQDQTAELNQKIAAGWKVKKSFPGVNSASGYNVTKFFRGDCYGTMYVLSNH
jgi:hypothetical protein